MTTVLSESLLCKLNTAIFGNCVKAVDNAVVCRLLQFLGDFGILQICESSSDLSHIFDKLF